VQETIAQSPTRRSLVVEIRDQVSHGTVPDSSLLPSGISIVERSRLIAAEGADHDLAMASLADPVRERIEHAALNGGIACLDVYPLPGVTDAEGDMASKALGLAGYPGVICKAGTRYRLSVPVAPDLRPVVEKSIGNPIVNQFVWSDADQTNRLGVDAETPDTSRVAEIDVLGASDEELAQLSADRHLALNLDEMHAIRDHFASIGRRATDVELQSIALAWSEHCSHKTFKAAIRHDRAGTEIRIDGLLSEYIAGPSIALHKAWVRSAFADNAGILAFDDAHDVSVKVETHNHPSALEPYGGAHTGVGGVIRDILAVSAVPIANMDVLCFGPLDLDSNEIAPGGRHPVATFRGVVRGIADYGNNMGIPTIGGAVLFDRGYRENPLVFCGTLGLSPTDSHPTNPQPGDAIVLLGGRTGRDGLHGATMSSETLESGDTQRSAVQIGAPITEKVVRDVLPLLRDERLYNAITDCGAGGLCSAVGEMGSALGFDCDLDLVPLKYEGLQPWEIWLSEAQERMIVAVPALNLARAGELCRQLDVEMTVIGHFTNHGSMRLSYDGRMVADLALAVMHGGCPRRELKSVAPVRRAITANASPASTPTDLTPWLLALLAHPNIASKEAVIRRFDHEVGGGTVIKPLTLGSGPSDAAVVKPLADSWKGVVVGHGINPYYGLFDSRAMALLAVDEALRNIVAVGGSIDRAALLDNFSWGEVDTPESLGNLVEAAAGCRDAVELFQTPFVSGKDSLRNCSSGPAGTTSIPGTLLITAVGVIEDVRRCITMDLKAPGNRLYQLGATRNDLAGSHLAEVTSTRLSGQGCLPSPPESTPELMRRLTDAISQGLVESCHDLSEGGLGVAASEMAIAGRLGVSLELDPILREAEDELTEVGALFSESSGRFVCEVSPEHATRFEALMQGLSWGHIGQTTVEPRIIAHRDGNVVLDIALSVAEVAWRTSLDPAGPVEQVIPVQSRTRGPARHRSGSAHTSVSVRSAKVIVLGAAGVNCDVETVQAFKSAGADPELVWMNSLLAGHRRLDEFSALVIPGGFSFGDHLGAGTVLAATMKAYLLSAIQDFASQGRPVVGICNGFQVLARLGLLGPISLAPNERGQFECRWVPLRAIPSVCPFVEGLDDFELPIAHGEGRLVISSGTEDVILKRAPLRYRTNPNGSFGDVAAICSPSGTILGLMPHPERFVSVYQHPAGPWRADDNRSPAGLQLFANVVDWAAHL